MIGKTIFIYGDAGTWKTTLANSAPGPRLFLDVEHRSDVLEGDIIEWDINSSTAPKDLKPTTTIIVHVSDITDIQRAVRWIKSGKLKVKSAIVDSVTQLQQDTIDDDYKGQMRKQDWGALLKKLAPDLAQLMKIAKRPETELECVVFTSWHSEYTVKDEDGEDVARIKPFIQGQLASRLSHMSDLIGYTTLDYAGKQLIQRLQIVPVDGVTARTCGKLEQKYGKKIMNPNLAEMLPDMTGRTTNV